MRVRVHPGDRKGVGHYRMIWPATAARHAGADVEIAAGLPILRAFSPAGRETITPQDIDCDVLVFQRPSHPELVALIPALQARGHAIVIDLDDDLAAVDPRNRASGGEDPRQVARACALADLVTVSTPPLAQRYAPHGRFAVLRNRIPAAVLSLPAAQGETLTVGWPGWTGTHPGDLRVTHGAVQDALDRVPGSRYLQIGPADGIRDGLRLHAEPDATGKIERIADWHLALGRLHVGLAPLADTRFGRAKSWLKPLELIARGVPFIASPLPEYEYLASLTGGGLLAGDRARSWRQPLVALLTDRSRREEMAARGRAHVAEHLTYEQAGHEWADAWATALAHRRSRPLAA